MTEYANADATFRELFRHDDWGRDLLLGAARPLTDEQLDRRFELGCGTLRATLIHMHEAAYWWMHVCQGNQDPPEPPAHEPVDALAARWREMRAARDELLAREPAALDRPITWRGRRDGRELAFPMRDVLLHVVNHGMHHRAQAVNMLRHLGTNPPPRVDYIFMKLAQPDTPPLSRDVLRDFYRYNDWATDRMLSLAEPLTDAQLDRPFEMGLGTLRRTLVHIADAERWWLGNWTTDERQTFPKTDETTTISALRATVARTAEARNDLLSTMRDDDALQRVVSAQPVKDFFRSFPIGQTMLQLCNHGTHHRAQAMNMLRHLRVPSPAMDYMVLKREELLTPSPFGKGRG